MNVRTKKTGIILFSTIFVFSLLSGSVFGQTETPTLIPSPTPTSSSSSSTPTPTPNNARTDDLNRTIEDLQDKINELQNQKKTLKSQIDVMDSQVKLTTLRINATNQEIKELKEDIDTTISKIFTLEKSLDELTKVLVNRIIATYQVGSTQTFQVLLSSGGISDFLSRFNYLRIAQAHDKKLLYETQQAKNDYANQKSIFEGKKQKVEALQAQLQEYTDQLNKEKADKENLLAVTNNSEQEYQRRLSDALRELQQIQKAARILVTTESRRVGRGEEIGVMGNTGYSFGRHLHFGIYNVSSLEQYDYYSNHENPANSLQGQNVDWQTECPGDPVGVSSTGGGPFSWPMSTGNLKITQGYGQTCYSNVYYRGNPHPAFDMYNNSDVIVRSVEEGQAYFCRNCTGDGANGVFIFHPNGKMSLYWHLQ